MFFQCHYTKSATIDLDQLGEQPKFAVSGESHSREEVQSNFVVLAQEIQRMQQ